MVQLIKLQVVIFLMLGVTYNGFSQEAIQKKYLWSLSGNIGSNLLWGDAGSSDSPFSRWFSSESNLSYGLVFNRKLSNTFGLQLGVQSGVLKGERDEWSNDTHPFTTSTTNYFDYHIGLNVDFTSLFGFKPDRFLSVYAFGGVGMMHYDAESFTDGVPYSTIKDNTLIIPWGGGVKLRFNERWNLYFETNYRNTFVDDIDAYEGSGSNVDDIYSITGIGLTYSFGEKRIKKPKVNPIPVEPADIEVAEVFVPVNIMLTSNLPKSAEPNSAYQISTVIDKEGLVGKGTYHLFIPENFYITNIESNGGAVEQDSANVKVSWIDFPAGDLTIAYTLTTGGLDKESYNFNSNFSYIEEGQNKMKTFNSRVNLKPSAIVAVIKPNENVDKIVDEVAEPMENNELTVKSTTSDVASKPVVANSNVVSDKKIVTPVAGLEYRVQIAAVFGGTTSKKMLQKRFSLDEEVMEDPYNNSYRYTVGSFNKYDQAIQHAALSKVNGAYVVVFRDGKYIGGLENTNTDIMDKNPLNMPGTTYKIQIAASKGRTYSIAKLAYKYGLQESQIYEDEIGGWYQYTVGKFDSKEAANPMLNEIRIKLKDAYVVKFVDQVRSK